MCVLESVCVSCACSLALFFSVCLFLSYFVSFNHHHNFYNMIFDACLYSNEKVVDLGGWGGGKGL